MNSISVIGDSKAKVTLSEKFVAKYNENVIHEVIVAMQSNIRSGTSRQLSRSEVSGGGAKPWRQKGTGRARAGTSRSPIWRKGGVTFASNRPVYEKKINKKVYSLAFRMAISKMFEDGNIVAFDSYFSEVSTKKGKSFLKENNLSGRVLFVLEQYDENTLLSLRNIPNVDVVTVDELNPLMVVLCDRICMHKSTFNKLEQRIVK